MASDPFHRQHLDDRARLRKVVRSVRNRWRFRMVLRGTALVALAAVVLLVAAGYAVDASRFDATAVAVARILAYLVFVAVLWLVLVRPLIRRVSDERVALYIDEHEPTLDGRLLSAV